VPDNEPAAADPASADALRIAMLAPISWRVPPRHYGPWEQFVSLLTEGLVRRGVDVTLFATADSVTGARLAAIVEYFRDASRYEGVLCLAGLNENLRTVFEIVRLDQVIPVFSSNAEAIGALKEGTVHPPGAALFGR
jgi:ABC-type transporter Mla MlaB component